MTETVSQAVAKRNEAEALISRYSGDFAHVLPSHVKPETFVRLSQGVLRRNEGLAKVAQRNPGSFLAALLDCARLGHEPGTEQYYLVPFGNEIQGIEGYRGVIERIYRAGAVSSVVCEVVRQGEKFEYVPGRMRVPVHQIDWDAEEEGPLKLAYAYAYMHDGSVSRVVVMKKAEILKHRAESKTASHRDSMWNKWEKAAWLKTVARELEKWVPSSAEFRREQLRAAVEADNMRRPQVDAAPAGPAIEAPVDAEIVDADADAAESPTHYGPDEVTEMGGR